MHLIILDTPEALQRFYPMVSARPVAALRLGIFTLQEWWQALLPEAAISVVSAPIFELPAPEAADGETFVALLSNRLPSLALAEKLQSLQPGEALEDDKGLIAFGSATCPAFGTLPLFFSATHTLPEPVGIAQHPMDWVMANGKHIAAQMDLVDTGGSTAVGQGSQVWGQHKVFIHPTAVVEGVIINAKEGPVYIGPHALVMEGSLLRGPLAIGQDAVVKMGTQLFGGTTIGKKATAGGEIKNSILGDYSNKAHHGYLGDSMVGQWCNLGAGTSNSNVKNNAGIIKMWSGFDKTPVPIGQKAGMLMGDFTRTAIHTSINSGTVIGACCSLHTYGFPPKHVPAFTWGDYEPYALEKLLRDIEAWMAFKKQTIGPDLIRLLTQLRQQA